MMIKENMSITMRIHRHSSVVNEQEGFMEKSLLSVTQAADSLNLGRTKFLQLVYSGEIQSLVIGRRRLINPLAIEAYIARLQAEQDQEV